MIDYMSDPHEKEATASKNSGKIVSCTYCGASNPITVMLCGNCGKKIQ
jgi:ribosomal protein L40E